MEAVGKASRRWFLTPYANEVTGAATLRHDDVVLVDSDSLRAHLGAIHEDTEGPFVWGTFDRVLAEFMVRRGSEAPGQAGYRPMRAVANRLIELRTIPVKLSWMLERRDSGELDPYMWMFFATSDISSYLTNARSLFDHLAHAIDRTSTKPGTAPHSFHDLRTWVAKAPDRAALTLGASIVEAVSAADWFDDLRDIRDELVHRDAETLVFPRTRRIAIAVSRGATDLITEDALYGSEDLVEFERLAAATAARIHVLLETVAVSIADRHGLLDGKDLGGRNQHSGLAVIRHWTAEMLDALG